MEEFLIGGGAREAARSLLELRAARYHHEFVKRAVVLSMDRNITQQESVSDLFHFLYKHEVRALMHRRAYCCAQGVPRFAAGERHAIPYRLRKAVRGWCGVE